MLNDARRGSLVVLSLRKNASNKKHNSISVLFLVVLVTAICDITTANGSASFADLICPCPSKSLEKESSRTFVPVEKLRGLCNIRCGNNPPYEQNPYEAQQHAQQNQYDQNSHPDDQRYYYDQHQQQQKEYRHPDPPDLPPVNRHESRSPYNPGPPRDHSSTGQPPPELPNINGAQDYEMVEPTQASPQEQATNSNLDLTQFNKDVIFSGLKRLYRKKILPLELSSKYGHFHSPPLSPSDFDAKPLVLLLGQYSVGKTSFIKYLLGRDFPGIRVGPEPTTDRFVSIMLGSTDKIIPGAALCSQVSTKFF